MITEDYVSFETAKLLKEKRFNERTYCYFTLEGEIRESLGSAPWNNSIDETGPICAPTLQMTMKWLREVYNLEIYPYHNDPTIINNSKWWFEIIKWPNSSFEYESEEDEEYDTYEEACESAINYCLKNLI